MTELLPPIGPRTQLCAQETVGVEALWKPQPPGFDPQSVLHVRGELTSQGIKVTEHPGLDKLT